MQAAFFFAQTLEKIFVQITSTNICDLVMSIVIMVVVFIVKELNDRYRARLPVPIPIEVMTVRETLKEDPPPAQFIFQEYFHHYHFLRYITALGLHLLLVMQL